MTYSFFKLVFQRLSCPELTVVLLFFQSQEEMDELKKKVAVLECQLRKSETAKKSFEMSTGKLLSFVEVMSHSEDHSEF